MIVIIIECRAARKDKEVRKYSNQFWLIQRNILPLVELINFMQLQIFPLKSWAFYHLMATSSKYQVPSFTVKSMFYCKC